MYSIEDTARYTYSTLFCSGTGLLKSIRVLLLKSDKLLQQDKGKYLQYIAVPIAEALVQCHTAYYVIACNILKSSELASINRKEYMLIKEMSMDHVTIATEKAPRLRMQVYNIICDME